MLMVREKWLQVLIDIQCILNMKSMLLSGQPQMIKVVHATAGKGVPVSMASGAVRAVLRSNVSFVFLIDS